MNDPSFQSSLAFSFDASLDANAARGWTAWRAVAKRRGQLRTTRWLLHRVQEELPEDEVADLVSTLLHATDPTGTAMAAAELAEITEGSDASLSMLFWEGVFACGKDASDGELLFEGAARLSGIEESEFDDPLAAAEYYLEFLNWRRQGNHSSDAESVLTAFDEVIRLAEADGAPATAAHFGRAQALYFALHQNDDPRSTTGEWDERAEPYPSWE